MCNVFVADRQKKKKIYSDDKNYQIQLSKKQAIKFIFQNFIFHRFVHSKDLVVKDFRNDS